AWARAGGGRGVLCAGDAAGPALAAGRCADPGGRCGGRRLGAQCPGTRRAGGRLSMSWTWLLLACAAAFAIKLAGYLVPARWLAGARMARVAGLTTIGLLAALVAVNTFADGGRLVFDARAGALLAAIVA